MRVRVEYTVDVDDEIRAAINASSRREARDLGDEVD